MFVYLSSICSCPHLFIFQSSSSVSVYFSWLLTVFDLFFLFFFIFNFPSLSLSFSFLFLFPFLSTLLPSSLSCLRGCWRRFRIWRPQFCLRKRESVTWRISFPSTQMALTDVHETYLLKNWSEFQNHYYRNTFPLHSQGTTLLTTLTALLL